MREIFNQLTNRDLALIDDDEVVYFRDVYDHLIRLTDELDNYRELVSGTLDVYLSTVNNNLSLIMKRLTGVTVVLAGIGAIAGIFGMSEAGPRLPRRGGARVLARHRRSPSCLAVARGLVPPPDRLDLSRGGSDHQAGSAARTSAADDRVGLRMGGRVVGGPARQELGDDLHLR